MLTIVVQNTRDTETDYALRITSSVTGPKVDATLITGITVFSFLTAVAVLLLVVSVIQYLYDAKYYR